MPDDAMGSRGLPQPPEIATRTVLLTVLAFFAFVALSMTGLMIYLRVLVPGGVRAVTRPFPEPTLQLSPQGDLDRFKVEQRAQITGFAWLDRPDGYARIPIESAMGIVAARGERAYDPAEGPAVTPAPGSRGGVRP
jgi:hypothetical protein